MTGFLLQRRSMTAEVVRGRFFPSAAVVDHRDKEPARASGRPRAGVSFR
jgi:hypothetical protein